MARVRLAHSRWVGNVVPQPDAAVEVESQYVVSVGREADVANGWIIVVEEERAQALAGRCVPYAAGSRVSSLLYTRETMEEENDRMHSHQSVGRAAHDQCPIPAEINTAHRIAVRRKTTHQATSTYVPQKDGLVIAPASEDVALGGEGEAVDVVMVAHQRPATTS